jgi:hypothetical protein
LGLLSLHLHFGKEKRKEKENLEINYNITFHVENSKIQNPLVEIRILNYINYSAYGAWYEAGIMYISFSWCEKGLPLWTCNILVYLFA